MRHSYFKDEQLLFSSFVTKIISFSSRVCHIYVTLRLYYIISMCNFNIVNVDIELALIIYKI